MNVGINCTIAFFLQHSSEKAEIPMFGSFISNVATDEEEHWHSEPFEKAVNNRIFTIIS